MALKMRMSLCLPPYDAGEGPPPPQQTPVASPITFYPRRVRRIPVFLARSTLFEVSGALARKLKFSGLADKGKWSGTLLESAGVEVRPRRHHTVANGDGNGKPECDTVYGVKPTNQCSGIMQAFDLSADELFFAINPNLNCNAIFVGQWICISGSA
ncbi:hypothetical protein ACLB2K_030186 [Fragaria x ananassa]